MKSHVQTWMACAALAFAAGSTLATPSITSMGFVRPNSVTNENAGTIYAGTGAIPSGNAGRVTISGGGLTFSDSLTSGSGLISADGQYCLTSILNGPVRFAIGNTATGVSPAFLAPTYAIPTLVPSATNPATTEFGGGRFSFVGSTVTNLGGPPIIAFTPNPGPKTVTTIVCNTGTATCTTSTAHGLAIGDLVVVTGNSTVTYNKLATVTGVPSATTFEYAVTCAANGTGGTATKFDVGNSGVFGYSSSSGSTGSFVAPNFISSTGRYVVGQVYVAQYNTGATAGTSISANSFYWRPFIWDAQGNGGLGRMDILPTPFRTTTSAGGNTRRRTGNPYSVSTDGLVVVGATEHNIGSANGADVDGGRLVVWRYDTGTSQWKFTYLDTGVDANGFPNSQSSTPSSVCMNSTGTIIAARGPSGITKWVWDGVSWGAPIVLGAAPAVQASWLPASVTSCGIPPTLGNIICMSDDGNIIAGSATYSTCGSFMQGGFIWHASDNEIKDWYDYNVAQATPQVGAGEYYGPIGDLGNPARGLPVIGNPVAISPDGTLIAGFQGGNQLIPGAPGWIWRSTGVPCENVSVATNPAATFNFSPCSSSIILSTSGAGSAPFTYQWYKNGVAMFDGTGGGGTNAIVSGSATFQLRVNPPLTPADAGTYYCVITGACGTPAQTANSIVQLDPAFSTPPANDTCVGAIAVGTGTNVLSPAAAICGAVTADGESSCGGANGTKVDMWYSFTPGVSGNYRLDTCGSNFDTVMSLFDGCNGNELSCNNDYNTGPSTGCTSSRSRISSIALNAGTAYKIRISAPVAAALSGTSTVNLSINPAPVLPANDSCNSAQPVTAPGVFAYNTTEAVADPVPGLSCASSSFQSRDVWFSFNAKRDQRVVFSTCPTGTAPSGYSLMTNTVLSLHDSPCGVEIGCNDNHSPVPAGCGSSLSTLPYVIAANTTVWVRVAGSNSTTFGAGQLSVSTCFSDIAAVGGTETSPGDPDGQLTVDDLIVFVNLFIAGTNCPGTAPCNRADVTGIGGFPADPDGELTVDDLIEFVNAFSNGC